MGHRVFRQWIDTAMLFRETAGTGLGEDWVGEKAAGGAVGKPQLVRMEGQMNRGDGGTSLLCVVHPK